MKKMIMMAVMAATMCATVFAQRADLIASWQNEIDKTDNALRKAEFLALINIEKTNPKTFDELKTTITESYAKFDLSAFSKDIINLSIDNSICLNSRGKFTKEGFEYSKKSDKLEIQQYFIVLWHNDKLGLSKEEAVRILSKSIINGKVSNIIYVKQGIEKIIPALNEFENEAEAKNILKKMNRTLSPKLLDDKATWEPVIAKIRTVLETY